MFEKFDRAKARIQNDFYGGGVAYLTDSRDIGVQYAKSMSKGGKGSPVLYTTDVRFRKLFDTTAYFDGKEVKQLLPQNIEGFARGAGLLSAGANRVSVLANLREGNIGMTGVDIFRGLSGGMTYTVSAREHLQRMGYDGLKYLGGTITGAIKHGVYLAYDPNSIIIKNAELVAFQKR